jgi:hypothetical protein
MAAVFGVPAPTRALQGNMDDFALLVILIMASLVIAAVVIARWFYR